MEQTFPLQRRDPVNYTTPATTLADSGEKFSPVVVTNNQGSVTSIDALLTVVPMSTPNKPPTVNAGGYQAVSLLTGADLNGIISDDGLPNPPGVVTATWTQVSGPGVTTFENPNLATTHATFSIDGVYVLRLTAFDGELSSSDNAQIVGDACCL